MTESATGYGKLANQDEEIATDLQKIPSKKKLSMIVLRSTVLLLLVAGCVVLVSKLFFFRAYYCATVDTSITSINEIATPLTTLESLSEGATISGPNWEAWIGIQNYMVVMNNFGICQVDFGVTDSQANFVLKKFEVFEVSDTIVNYTIPPGYLLKGVIAFDNWTPFTTGATCSISVTNNVTTVHLMSPRTFGLDFNILIIATFTW